MNNLPPEPPQKPQGGNNNDEGDNPEKPIAPNQNAQRIWMLIALASVVVLLFAFNNSSNSSDENYPLHMLAQDVRNGNVVSIVQEGEAKLHIEYANNDTRVINVHPSKDVYTLLQEDLKLTESELARVDISYKGSDNSGAIAMQLILGLLPILLLIWLIWRMTRRMGAGPDQAMSFGKSRARVSRDVERPQVTFSDVAGAEEAKEELKEIVEFLKEPEKFIQLGARVPKGVLMVGPPGTGKTLMARAVAGEAAVPFFSISGSEFVEMFVGVGASRVRDLFTRSKAEAPAIVFIDEIDAVGRHRGAGLGGGHDEREQTLNQILVEMDGFETDTNVIIIAATNRPDILDPALMRPGRFDRKVTLDLPDVKGRQAILKVHAKGKPLAPNSDLEAIAKVSVGFSGADLENLINEAAILAARRNLKTIGMSELQESMERSVMGPERRSLYISEKVKRVTAYHEAGHAILFHLLEHADSVHKVTIIPRGRAGGYVMPLPDEDTSQVTREQFIDRITAAMGGRAAEELILGHLSTGASNDLQQSTGWVWAMVTKFGMSEKLGPRSYGDGGQQVFLGRAIGEQRNYSEHYAREIDDEVRNILQGAYDRAKSILSDNRSKLERLTEVLLEEETLERQTFEAIMDGES